MNNRIRMLLERKALTALRFAEILQVQPSSISHLLSGRNKPSCDFIEKILVTFPEVDPDWLILGRGEMYRNESKDLLGQKEASNHLATVEPDLFLETPKKMVTNMEMFDKESINDSGITCVNKSRRVCKVILYYSDNTFEEIVNN